VAGEVEGRLAELALVPVIEIPDAKLAAPLAEALISGGLPCAEITLRTQAAADAIAVSSRRTWPSTAVPGSSYRRGSARRSSGTRGRQGPR
jgi:2-keto-3-deoxy-6-phosphogluconate aldolase